MSYNLSLPNIQNMVTPEKQQFENFYALLLFLFRAFYREKKLYDHFIQLQSYIKDFELDDQDEEIVKNLMQTAIAEWGRFDDEEYNALVLMSLIYNKKIWCFIDYKLVDVFDEPITITNQSTINLIDQSSIGHLKFT